MATQQVTKYYCKTCGKLMESTNFYMSNDKEKYPPDGHFSECKKCLTRHVNNFRPETYLWILQEADVPYVEDEWNTLLNRYAQDPKKITTTTIIGRYLSKMKLTQYKDYRWKDSDRIQGERLEIRERNLQAQGYTPEEIEEELASIKPVPAPQMFVDTVEEEEPAPIDLVTPEYFTDDLTEEDRKYLSIKWGRAYKPFEWVQLEQLYSDMTAAFDIQTPAQVDYLKLICKTSLKCNQLLDLNDIEGFQKMSKTYDMLMKSSKFTAAQNKLENGEYLDTVSELVAMAEREGFIPRFYVDKPADKVDETLADFRKYTENLVRNELNLGNLIESAARTMAQEEERNEDSEDEITLEGIDMGEEQEEDLTDIDFQDYFNFTEEQKNKGEEA